MLDFYENKFMVNGEQVEGWFFLPRICIKVYTEDTFLYSILNEF
jgi:hypothetical protein